METRKIRPYLILLLLLGITSGLLAFTVDVRVTDEAGIEATLPDRFGDWAGTEIRFCQTRTCQKEFEVDAVTNRDVCPACGGVLDSMSLPEKLMLPSDTVVLKKRYRNSAGRILFLSIVMSGSERASIHRPQLCLVGQGNEIVETSLIHVPLGGEARFDVTLLDMIYRARRGDGTTFELPRFYAYWFVGKNRETPSHVQRMIWMATDRVFRNVSHRWAYIALMGNTPRDGSDYRAELAAFLKDLHPLLVRR